MFRRQREMEQKIVEEETAKRIEVLVNKRVEEELEKRKEEIEAEVLRRVEEAKKEMQREMMLEMERRKQQLLDEEKRREVLDNSLNFSSFKNLLNLYSQYLFLHPFSIFYPCHMDLEKILY